MFGRVKEWLFDPGEARGPSHVDRVALATCAVLLEAAYADDEFSEEERSSVIAALQRQFELSPDKAADLVREAQGAREAATDLWRFTHLINERFSTSEKFGVVREIWRLVYADGTLHGHEDYFMHKLQRLLNLEHADLIAAKMQVLRERQCVTDGSASSEPPEIRRK